MPNAAHPRRRDIAKHLAESYADQSDNWMHWAYAFREMDQIEEAKAVALRGLELHPDEAILHYNLACYLSLLGEFDPVMFHHTVRVTDGIFAARNPFSASLCQSMRWP